MVVKDAGMTAACGVKRIDQAIVVNHKELQG